MLIADPEFSNAYLAAAFEETKQTSCHQAVLTTLQHIADA